MNKEQFDSIITQLELDGGQVGILNNIGPTWDTDLDDEEFDMITIQLELSVQQDVILESINFDWDDNV